MSEVTRVYLKENVFEAALDRIRYLFSEFPSVYANMSGGKDSTVILHLCLMVARETGRLPLRVLFVDQEAEYAETIRYMRSVADMPEVEMHWLQCPLRISNTTSNSDPWLWCWKEGDRWMREKEPDSVHENRFGTLKFYRAFESYLKMMHPEGQACNIAGVRCEESPARAMGLTNLPTYKHVTWGNSRNKEWGIYTFHPIYDWGHTDVWKAIHDNKWPYSRIYDWQFQHGIPVQKMRVSSLHHETAVHCLTYLQEMEPDTWAALVARLEGINTLNHLSLASYLPSELPSAFRSWAEYRDYLLEHIVPDPEMRERFERNFRRYERSFEGCRTMEPLYKVQAISVLTNDFQNVRLNNFFSSPGASTFRLWKQGKPLRKGGDLKFIPLEALRNAGIEG